jgi:hypothetical protein
LYADDVRRGIKKDARVNCVGKFGTMRDRCTLENKRLQLGKVGHARINGHGKDFVFHGCSGSVDGSLGDTAELELFAMILR